MDFRVLGGIELARRGTVLPLGGAKPRLLLAVLLAHRRHVVRTDVLAEALWGEAPPATARATLQTHLSKLRQLLGADAGATLTTRPPGYVLDVQPAWVDADRFEHGLHRARALLAAAPHEAAAGIDDALAQWRGPAFAEFADREWARGEATRLEELRLVAFEERIAARLAVGDHAAVIGELEGLARAHPLRERFWGQWMVALHRSGRQGEALRTAQVLRRQLVDELGLEPSAELRRLEHAIAADDPALRPPPPPAVIADAPRVRTTAPDGGALPVAATALVGRTGDLDRLAALLPAGRVLTLLGPGGVGKSRLAVELARRADPALPGRGAPRRAGTGPRPRRRGRRGGAGARASSADRSGRSPSPSSRCWRPLRLLLILDNCEHVIEAVGELVGRHRALVSRGHRPRHHPRAHRHARRGRLGRCSRCRCPPSAALSPAEIAAFPAVQVFRRARREASRPFDLDEQHRAGGGGDLHPPRRPAARARAGGGADDVDEPRGSWPTGSTNGSSCSAAVTPRDPPPPDPARRRAVVLRPAVAAGAGLLLARLSVFAGGFDLEAAEQTCAADELAGAPIASLLAALVDKSMVVAVHARRPGALPASSRRCASSVPSACTSSQTSRWCDGAHVATFVARAERGRSALDGPDECRWAKRLDDDFDNLRAACPGRHRRRRRRRRPAAVRGHPRARLPAHPLRGRRLGRGGRGPAPARRTTRSGPPCSPSSGYGSFVRGELDRSIELGRDGDRLRASAWACPRAGCRSGCSATPSSTGVTRPAAWRWMDRWSPLHGRRRTPAASATPSTCTRWRRPASATPSGAPSWPRRPAGGGGRPAARPPAARPPTPRASPARPPTSTGPSCCSTTRRRWPASVDNRWMRAFAMTELLWLRARRGETGPALEGYRDVVETWYRGGDWANQWLSLRQLAGVLAALGHDEDAALLFGAVDAAGPALRCPVACRPPTGCGSGPSSSRAASAHTPPRRRSDGGEHA